MSFPKARFTSPYELSNTSNLEGGYPLHTAETAKAVQHKKAGMVLANYG